MSLGIKLGTKEEIDAILGSEKLYTCFSVYELPASIIHRKALSLLKSAYGNGVRFTIHAPHPFNSNGDIASPDNRVREEAIDSIRSAIDIAAHLPAEVIVIHCGIINHCGKVKRGGTLAFKRTIDDALQIAKDSLLRLYDYSKDAGVCLTIENDAVLPGIDTDDETRANMGGICQTVHEITYILDGLRELGLTLDIGHSYGTANYLKKEPYDFMRSVINSIGIERIKNVHLTDIIGSVDYHVAVGDGTIDFCKVFSLLKEYRGPIILENFPNDIYKSIENLHAVCKSLIDKHGEIDLADVRRFCIKMGWKV